MRAINARVHTNVAADVCRFWSGATYTRRTSHFYTSSVRECAIVKTQPE